MEKHPEDVFKNLDDLRPDPIWLRVIIIGCVITWGLIAWRLIAWLK